MSFVFWFSSTCLSDVGMFRFQTSEALWDRSSVSAGSGTVSLYQLQCLVEALLLLLLRFILLHLGFCSALSIAIIIFIRTALTTTRSGGLMDGRMGGR